MPPLNHSVFDIIAEKASREGFNAIGISPPDIGRKAQKSLSEFVTRGEHGTMMWMRDNLEKRLSPRHLWPETKSIIMLGMNYGPDTDPLALLDKKLCGSVSVYARHFDYHDILKKKLRLIARFLAEEYDCRVKIFVDTAPIAEKPLARRAGLGWVGKHTNLVSRDFGSWLFLGAIFTTLDLPFSEKAPDLCGSCQNCLDICPTRAFSAPYKLDARKCISYLTIEHKGVIPREFRTPMGNRIYGCDDCLAVCPWNKFARLGQEAGLQARSDLKAPALADFLAFDDKSFRDFFRKSPVKRTGYIRFLRNVLIAAGNSRSTELAHAVSVYISHEHELLRAHAIWALSQIDYRKILSLKKLFYETEKSACVREEWEDLSEAEALSEGSASSVS